MLFKQSCQSSNDKTSTIDTGNNYLSILKTLGPEIDLRAAT